MDDSRDHITRREPLRSPTEEETTQLFATAAINILRRAAHDCDCDWLGEYLSHVMPDPSDHPNELLTAMRRLAGLAYTGDLEGIRKMAEEDADFKQDREESEWWKQTVLGNKRARTGKDEVSHRELAIFFR
jgi:hypothetical protein